PLLRATFSPSTRARAADLRGMCVLIASWRQRLMPRRRYACGRGRPRPRGARPARCERNYLLCSLESDGAAAFALASGRAFTATDAGFAEMVISSPVAGLRPGRS